MDIQEAYQALGLDPGVDDARLKAAWRRLVSAWHPDRNKSAEAARRMAHINKAYDHIRQIRSGVSVPSDTEAPAPADTSDASETAETFEARTESRTVHLTLDQAVLGCVRSLRGRFTHGCRACEGQGQRVLDSACQACAGRGSVRRAALFGWLWTQEDCADCGGQGRAREVCGDCGGAGERSVKYRRSVRFPAGVRAGDVLTVPSTRHEGFELSLELRVEFEPHPFFILDEAGLRCEMPVDGYAWMAQRWVDVPVPGGVQQMRLQREALVYRLRGQGFPLTPKGERGDFIVKVLPQFPEDEDEAVQEALDRLVAASARAAEAQARSPLGEWRRRLGQWQPKLGD